jgi:DNA mismatch endonuclease (patch repair protein)
MSRLRRPPSRQRSVEYPWPTSSATSAVMRANPSRDTSPELQLRSALHAEGHRFRANLRLEVLGFRVRPDVVFTKARVAVFVDGCFWHSCPDHGTRPRSNKHYWLPKLRRVLKRDRRADRQLTRAGWAVVRVWEHASAEEAVRHVAKALRRSASVARARLGPAKSTRGRQTAKP